MADGATERVAENEIHMWRCEFMHSLFARLWQRAMSCQRQGNVFDEKFDNTLFYRPKTKENQQRYENFLGRLYQIVEDFTQEALVSMADEVLAIIRGEGTEDEKKVNAEAILSEKIAQEKFFDLVNIAKGITDYDVENEDQMAEEDIAIDDE